MTGDPESANPLRIVTSSTSSAGRLSQPIRQPGARVFDAVPIWTTRPGSSPWTAPMACRS